MDGDVFGYKGHLCKGPGIDADDETADIHLGGFVHLLCPLWTNYINFNCEKNACDYRICRLPSHHQALIKWSAPVFLKIDVQGFGFNFGKQSREAFAVCTTAQLENILSKKRDSSCSRKFSGIEFSSSCGRASSEKTDILSVMFGEELDLVCASTMRGAILGMSFMCTCVYMR